MELDELKLASVGNKVLARFLNKVRQVGDHWDWMAYREPLGYGQFGVSTGKQVRAYRFSYEQFIGPIPRGLEIDHLCRRPQCVRPDHLEAVTHLENMRRGTVLTCHSDLTHCRRGHPYSGDNLVIKITDGGRDCRICKNARGRAYNARQKEREAGK